MNSVYAINKGVNRPVVFRGLKAQYIWWLGMGLGILLLFFVFLYLVGVSIYICLFIIALLGILHFYSIYQLNHRFGTDGLLKRIAQRATPKWISCDQKFKQ